MQSAAYAYSTFFRPSPSRLSPGRNTVFVPLYELCRVQQHPSLGSLKRAWTITQSKKSSRRCGQKQNQNSNPKQKHKTQNKNTKQKTPRDNGRALTKKGSLCADELRKDLAESNTKPTRHHSKIAMKVQKQSNRSAVPKPRIPPARIPEIAQ